MKKTITLALVVLLALSAAPTFAADVDMSAQIAAAKTPADHEAIADEYAKQAAEAEANAVRHDKMAESYKGLGKMGAYHQDQHCRTLAVKYREEAKDLKELAAAHRAEAKALAK